MARPRKNPITVNKVCENCKTEFTVKYAKHKQKFCSRSCGQQSDVVQKKIKDSQLETYRQKYGVEHPMKTSGVVNKFKESMKNKHGVEHALQKKEFVDKSKSTSKSRHGDANYRNTDRYKKTCIDRYGVDNFVKTEKYKEKYKSTCLDKYGTDHASQSSSFKIKHVNTMFEKFLTHERFVNFAPLFDPTEYFGVLKDLSLVKYKFKCIRCENVSSYNLNNGNPIFCVNCDKNDISYFQKEVYNYIRSILPIEVSVVVNDRTTIRPQELDIYIPSLNMAIECDGIYWHSEVIGGKNKIYHVTKTDRCESLGIKLIHIFESDWRLKTDVVKSILKTLLVCRTNRIYGRECEVKYVSNISEVNDFLEKNHIQGGAQSSIKIGLYHKNKLVSLMTFGKSRFDKTHEWEMVRYCNLLDHSVVGGASKLFKFFVKNHQPKSVISYSDRRYFTGDLYKKLNFSFISNTSPNYWYVVDNYKTIKNRMSFQKHKLPKLLGSFDPSLTEWDNMRLHGFDRIWDCGNGKWSYINS